MSSPHVLEITAETFERETAAPAGPILIEFSAVWCPPCRAIEPHIDALAATYAGRVRVAKCDADANPELTAALDVRSIPTLLVFKNGRVIAQMVGAAPRAKLESLFQRALDAAA